MAKLQEDTLKVPCPICNALILRRCVRVVGLDRGSPLADFHKQRKELALKEELKNNKLLATIPITDIKCGQSVRSHKTRLFGKIIFVGNDNIVIRWETGKDENIKHLLAANVLEWKELVA